jgi:hypothetical protein
VFSAGGVAAQPQFFLMTDEGLVAVTGLQAAIQLADPRTADAYADRSPAPIPISARAASGARSAADPTLPATAPHPVAVDPNRTAVCFDLNESTTLPPPPYLLAIPGPIGVASAAVPVDTYGAPIADYASVPAGRAVIAVALSEPTHTDGAWYLVTDLGVRYPLGADALAALGYAGVTPVRLPEAAISLFPMGPRLDRADAQELQPVVPRPPAAQAAPSVRVHTTSTRRA